MNGSGSAATTDRGVRTVKSAGHTVAVLEFLASRGDRLARIREITDATGIPRSSAYALLKTLADLGWIERDASGLLYGVGLRALIAGISYLDNDPYVQVATNTLITVSEELGETVHLARLDGTDVVYLATRESNQYLRVINRVGRRMPASATSLGKALLAQLSEGELVARLPDPLPRLTADTVTDRAVLLRELAQVRERGYAVDRAENTAGLHCLGVALPYGPGFDKGQVGLAPADAISCSVPLGRLTAERERLIIERLTAAATEIGTAARRSIAERSWATTNGRRP